MKTFLAYRGGEVDEVATLAEVHALLRAVAEEVRKLPHETFCPAARCWFVWESSGKFCSLCESAHDRLRHDYQPDECNCPRGCALALLEVKP